MDIDRMRELREARELFYTEVPVPIYVNPIRLMGVNGIHLKSITDKSGCHYIWVDITRRVVEIWGRDLKLAKAIALVRQRIAKLTRLFKPNELLVDEGLQTRINVTCWQMGLYIYYDITATEQDAEAFLKIITKTYPSNPYSTQVEKRTSTGILVTRFSSCD